MVCPILISVSLVPGPYCFWASAGCADRAAIAAPNSAIFLTNIGFLHFFVMAEVSVKRLSLARTRGRLTGRVSNATRRRDHSSSSAFGFRALRGLAPTEDGGLMLSGLPAAAVGSGSG